MSVWSRAGPQKAETVLWQWEEEHDQGMCEMWVDERIFNTLFGGRYHSKFLKLPIAATGCCNMKSMEI
jgi:hypothetical protein